MSILPFASQSPVAAASGNGNRPFSNQQAVAPQDRPKAQLWLNVGYEINNGEETSFIQLPNGGIPLDTMSELPMRGQNDDFLKRVAAQNDLLKTLVTEGQKLDPGGEVTLNLTIKMRRVNAEKVVDQNSNQYAVKDLASHLIVKPAPQIELQPAAE